jgi:hypothetical protein
VAAEAPAAGAAAVLKACSSGRCGTQSR